MGLLNVSFQLLREICKACPCLLIVRGNGWFDVALGYGLGAVPTLCQKGHPWGRRREIGCAPKWTPQFFALLLQADLQGFEEFFWSLLMYSMLCDGNKINKKYRGGGVRDATLYRGRPCWVHYWCHAGENDSLRWRHPASWWITVPIGFTGHLSWPCLLRCKPFLLLISMPPGLSVEKWAAGKYILLHSHTGRGMNFFHFYVCCWCCWMVVCQPSDNSCPYSLRHAGWLLHSWAKSIAHSTPLSCGTAPQSQCFTEAINHG